MKTEEPYFDKNGREIKEYDLLKVYHFTGARRKKHYMYKWVKLKHSEKIAYWAGFHLSSESTNNYYLLMISANNDRVLEDAEIIQGFELEKR